MCLAAFKPSRTLSQQLQDKISANDPLSRALGYEGLADPLGDLKHRMSGTKSELTKKIERNQAKLTQEFIDAERPGTPGHVRSIAAFNADKGR